jgi:hypothetical protein
MDVKEVTREFWRRIEAPGWDALRELLSEDIVVE